MARRAATEGGMASWECASLSRLVLRRPLGLVLPQPLLLLRLLLMLLRRCFC